MSNLKPLCENKIPPQYHGKLTATAIFQNLIKFINAEYRGDVSVFKKDYKKLLSQKYSAEEIRPKSKLLNQKFSKGKDGRRFTLTDARDFEASFGLDEGCLLLPDVSKEVAYVFVECAPSQAHKLFIELSENCEKYSILDECSLLSGDADVFLRLYGTREQIRNFIFESIDSTTEFVIQRTKTHFSFTNDNWQRYPTATHTRRETSRPYWLSDDWENPVGKLI